MAVVVYTRRPRSRMSLRAMVLIKEARRVSALQRAERAARYRRQAEGTRVAANDIPIQTPTRPVYEPAEDFLIPRYAFQLLVQEIVQDLKGPDYGLRMQSSALRALQESAEAHLVAMFEDANAVAEGAGRDTLQSDDMCTVLRLRRIGGSGYGLQSC